MSEVRNITIDYTNPVIALSNPADESILSSGDIDFRFNLTDINGYECYLYIDDVLDTTISTSGSYDNEELNISKTLSDGSYDWFINCTDLASNSDNSVAHNFTIDSNLPDINLMSPDDSAVITTDYVTLQFNVTDTNLLNCSLDVLFDSYFIDISGSGTFINSTTLYNLSETTYNWSVLCYDLVGDIRSDIREFTIDLTNPFIEYISPAHDSRQNLDYNVSFDILYKDYGYIDTITANLTDCNSGVIFELSYTDTGQNAQEVRLNETRTLGFGEYCYNTYYCDNAMNCNTESYSFSVVSLGLSVFDDWGNFLSDNVGAIFVISFVFIVLVGISVAIGFKIM